MYSARLNKLIQDWREKLDQNLTVDAFLMDPSNEFDCILDKLLIAKLAVYGFTVDALASIFSYLKFGKKLFL